MPHALLSLAKLSLLLQGALAPPTPGATTIVTGIIAIAVAVKATADYFGDRKRERQHAERLDGAVKTISDKVDQSEKATHAKIDALALDVRDVIADVKGTDGEGGMRAEQRELKKRVVGLEDRERDRLQQGAVAFDRRRSST